MKARQCEGKRERQEEGEEYEKEVEGRQYPCTVLYMYKYMDLLIRQHRYGYGHTHDPNIPRGCTSDMHVVTHISMYAPAVHMSHDMT